MYCTELLSWQAGALEIEAIYVLGEDPSQLTSPLMQQLLEAVRERRSPLMSART